MNEGFPNTSPKGIKPYIDCSFVLIHEDGGLIPLDERGFGDADDISPKITQRLKKLQDKGFKIMGSVHPFYKEQINIEGDMEIYQPFPVNSAGNTLLLEHGVDLVYEREAT